eukprot:NODE_1675_length_1336_cov_8.784771_g1390_i0.p1 GENE.NODE_1675_length_1336_cov_8.784771_g1390_i0~~NODE_1675_length_1336_cov_8.784771_g1390_i0.p1  ORF type:complete len:374 (+),score=62.51 NODE_1675_length_1336_cov_8.784771_g1390_i0:123-1244(+)
MSDAEEEPLDLGDDYDLEEEDTKTEEQKAAKFHIGLGLLVKNKAPKLDLRRKKIGDAEVEELSERLASNTALREIILDENSITDESAAQLVLAVAKKRSGLTTLKLGNNAAIGKVSSDGSALAKALVDSTNLTDIDLSYCSISGAQAGALVKAITTTTVTALNLSNNMIGAQGAKSVGEALRENHTIARLDLSFSGMGDGGCKEIVNALKDKSQLTHLDLSYNGISKDGVEQMLDDIRENASLRVLNFEDTDIPEEDLESVKKKLSVNGFIKPERPVISNLEFNQFMLNFTLEPKVMRMVSYTVETKASGHEWRPVFNLNSNGGINLLGARQLSARLFGVSSERTYIARILASYASGTAASDVVVIRTPSASS